MYMRIATLIVAAMVLRPLNPVPASVSGQKNYVAVASPFHMTIFFIINITLNPVNFLFDNVSNVVCSKNASRIRLFRIILWSQSTVCCTFCAQGSELAPSEPRVEQIT
jgi:hypothetical protein